METQKKILLLLFLIAFISINAQIVYTDVMPDILVSSQNTDYYLDLNNDNTKDFDLRSFNNTAVEIYTYPNQEAEMLCYLNSLSTNSAAQFFIEGTDTISSQPSYNYLEWVNTFNNGSNTAKLLRYSKYKSETQSYLGLRIKINSQWHYGWVRLIVAENFSNFTVLDYAYNATADTPIKTGQTTTGLEKINYPPFSLQVFPNPSHGIINVNMGSDKHINNSIIITDVLGNILFEKNNVENDISIDLSNQVKGIYFLKIADKEQVRFSKRICIQ